MKKTTFWSELEGVSNLRQARKMHYNFNERVLIANLRVKIHVTKKKQGFFRITHVSVRTFLLRLEEPEIQNLVRWWVSVVFVFHVSP